MDDVTFPYSVVHVSCVFLSGKSITAKTTASIPTRVCSTIRIASTHRGLCTAGDVGYLRLPCSLWFLRYASGQADIQTYYHSISHPSLGEVMSDVECRSVNREENGA